MSSIVIAGDTSGTCTLQAANVAGNTVLNLPTTSGTLVSSGSIPAAGSTTQVQYNNAGAFAGSSNFVFDGTNVGIGTSSPGARLDARGNALFGANARIQLTESAGDAVIGGTAGTNFTAFTVNNTERMRIDSSGNVGIGTSSPDAKLKVVASGANLLVGFSGTQNYFDASENIFRNFAGTERMRIDSSGNVFVGGSGTISGATNPIYSSTTAKAWINFNGNTSPGTINASFNVSSVTKNSTGNWTINFTNAFVDSNYVFVGSGLPNDTAGTNGNFMVAGNRTSGPTLKSTTQCTVVNGSTSSNVFWDNLQAMCAFFR